MTMHAFQPQGVTNLTATRFACSECKGVQGRHLGTAPTCPNAGLMFPVKSMTPLTGCLHDPANFRALPVMRKTHFVPRTGRGKFDVAYNPNNGHLDITVKMNLATTAKYFSWSTGFTAEELLRIQTEFRTNVPAFWDGKWRFVCRKAGFGTLPMVTPRFHIEFDTPLGSHFKLIIAVPDHHAASNPAPQLRNCRGFVSINQIVSNDPTVQDRVELLDFHSQDFQHGMAPRMIAQHERQRLEEALKGVGVAATTGQEKWIFMSFDAIGETQRVPLRNLAQTGLQRVSQTHKVPLVFKGVRRMGEGMEKARERANAVASVLALAGFDNPVEHLDGEIGDPPGVKIRINTAYEDNVPEITYNVAAHEFGHMIGLPDEYENPQAGGRPEDNAKFQAKTRFLDLVGLAGMRPPVFPSHTMSMMSDGMTIQPFHAVTVWDALCFLTKGIIDPAEWETMMV